MEKLKRTIFMLIKIDHNLWVAEQPFRYFGLNVGTRMTIIELKNKQLVIISPIQINSNLINQINEIGTVAYIIAPNLYHHLFVKDWQTHYPNAKFYAVPGLETKRPDLLIDQIISPQGKCLFDEIDYLFFDGFKTLSLSGFDLLNECVFFHPSTQTLILTDTAFHFDENFAFTTKLVTRILGGYKTLSPSLLEKVATTDKERVKKSVQKIIQWDFQRVIMAHGSIIETEGKLKFQQGYQNF